MRFLIVLLKSYHIVLSNCLVSVLILLKKFKMKQMSLCELPQAIYSITQLLGWTIFLLKVLGNIAAGNLTVLKDPSTFQTLQIVQTMQFIDIIFIILGLSRSRFVPALVQVGGRNFVVWLVFKYTLDSIYPIVALIPWSLADIIRFALYSNNLFHFGLDWLKLVRYNAFIILYPVGVTGEFTSAGAAKDFIQTHNKEEKLTAFDTEMPISVATLLNIFRIIAYPGLAFMFSHMLKLRSRFYQNQKKGLKNKKEE